MLRNSHRNDQDQEVIALTTEILPVWNIIATCIMLVASITTLIVFTADAGRYVPAGSVLGFEGPSYFYITGFWGFILATGWGISIACKLKRFSISACDDGAMLFREQVIGKARELTIPKAALKAVLVKQHPSGGNIFWFVVSFGWFAFILQFAIPNFQLPFLEFPAAGITLLVFGGCTAITAVIGTWKPGFRLIIIDLTACHVIEIPGVIASAALASKLIDALEKSFKLHPIIQSRSGFYMKTNGWFWILLSGSGCFLILGAANVVLLLANSSLPSVNLISAWIIMIVGGLGLILWKNRGNDLLLHLRVPFQASVAWTGNHYAPKPWMLGIGSVGCVILWYFFGLNLHFVVTGLDVNTGKVLSIGFISLLYMSWCIHFGLETSRTVLVNSGDAYSIKISAFSLSVQKLNKITCRAKNDDHRIPVTIFFFFIGISVASLIAGLCK